MKLRTLALLFISFLATVDGSASAQSEARIRTIIPRIDHAEDDLKWIIELSPTKALKDQWMQLKENVLDGFTQGFDLGQPFQNSDLVFRKDELAYELRIPVSEKKPADLKGRDGLLANIKASGFQSRRRSLMESSYEFARQRKRSRTI